MAQRGSAVAALPVAVSDERHGGWHPGFGDPRYLIALDDAVAAALAVAGVLTRARTR